MFQDVREASNDSYSNTGSGLDCSHKSTTKDTREITKDQIINRNRVDEKKYRKFNKSI